MHATPGGKVLVEYAAQVPVTTVDPMTGSMVSMSSLPCYLQPALVHPNTGADIYMRRDTEHIARDHHGNQITWPTQLAVSYSVNVTRTLVTPAGPPAPDVPPGTTFTTSHGDQFECSKDWYISDTLVLGTKHKTRLAISSHMDITLASHDLQYQSQFLKYQSRTPMSYYYHSVYCRLMQSNTTIVNVLGCTNNNARPNGWTLVRVARLRVKGRDDPDFVMPPSITALGATDNLPPGDHAKVVLQFEKVRVFKGHARFCVKLDDERVAFLASHNDIGAGAADCIVFNTRTMLRELTTQPVLGALDVATTCMLVL
jgi:hypothetical protein